MSRMPLVLGAVVAAFALAPAAAQAGDVSVSGDVITFTGAPGEASLLSVNWGGGSPSVSDSGGGDITWQAPCEELADGTGIVECPTAGPRPRVVIRLGDGNDIADVANADEATGPVQLLGEDGDDRLAGGAAGDLLDGGNGNDQLTPDDDEPGAGDVVVGGPGTDTLQTGNPTGASGPIAVSFDGQANDGYPGEGDSYATDLEDLSAPQTAPSIAFVGTDGPNVVTLRSESPDTVAGLGGDDRIDGANGNDVLDGGAGNDTILGGGNDDVVVGGPGVDSLSGDATGGGLFTSVAGNDRIEARDGEVEALNCGLGADTAIVDAADVVPSDPGSLCEVVDRPVVSTVPLPPPPVAGAAGTLTIASTRLAYRAGRIGLVLRCAGSGTCRGSLSVRTAERVRSGSRRRVVTVLKAGYVVPAGASRTLRLRPTSPGRSLLRRTSRVRVRVAATPTGGRAVTRTLTLR